MTRPLAIALVTHNVIKGDGQGRVNYEIVAYALQNGASVTVLSDQLAPELVKYGAIWEKVRPAVRRPVLAKVILFAWGATKRLRALKRTTRFDVVCGNGYVLHGRHTVNCAHFVHGAWLRSNYHTGMIRRDFYGLYQTVYSRINFFLERRAFSSAKWVVAVSDRVSDELTSIGVPRNKIVTIPNGVDLEEFHPGRSDREALGLQGKRILALFVGGLRLPLKNMETILRALVRVPEVDLVVVGEIKGSPYPALAASLGVSNRVHFLGYRRDVAAIMRAVDFFVFPSRSEPFGLVVLEAMASGLPVITASSVGASSIVNSECGYVIDEPDNVSALAGYMNELGKSPSLRVTMGRSARIAAERHAWSQMASCYISMFETMI